MKPKKIEVVKEWLKPKSVWDIQVFLSFVNFYRRFIQSFSKIAASLTLMLKITMSSQVLVANKMFAANEVDGVKCGDKSIEKYGKLSKTGKLFKSGKSKSEKLFNSRKSKSEKTSKS